jgi:hypothetical protein
MAPYDIAGLAGALLILLAYAGVQFRKLDPHRLAALALNLAGASLVILSLTEKFNLAAFVLEAAWAVIAAFGILRLAIARSASD